MIDVLANRWAARIETEEPYVKERDAYNFKVTGFNALTAAVIGSIAATIFSSSYFLLVSIATVSLIVRRSFKNNIEQIDRRTLNVPEYFGLSETSWKSNKIVLLDFVIWKNRLPQQKLENIEMEEQKEGDVNNFSLSATSSSSLTSSSSSSSSALQSNELWSGFDESSR